MWGVEPHVPYVEERCLSRDHFLFHVSELSVSIDNYIQLLDNSYELSIKREWCDVDETNHPQRFSKISVMSCRAELDESD